MSKNNRIIKESKFILNEEGEEYLRELRDKVDEIDDKIVELLRERLKKALVIGKIKRDLGRETYNPDREREIRKRILTGIEEDYEREAMLRIYERIIDESRSAQKKDGKVDWKEIKKKKRE
jgi:chorismate mutase